MSDTILEISSTKYPSDHDGWAKQRAALALDLVRAGAARRNDDMEAGAKGGAAEIILALGTAGAITAFVEVARIWLASDPTRVLKLRLKKDGTRELELRETNTKSETDVKEAIEKFFAK